ncbi:DUF2059 domain-containing protein [Sphingomonas sp. CJ20]
MKHLVAALALGTTALIPFAASAHTPVAPAPAPSPEAEKLIALLVGEEAMVRMGSRAFDVGIEQEIAADPQAGALYATDPGLKTYVSGKLRETFVTVLRRELPTLRGQLIDIVARAMTPGEIADTLTFFSSPVGKKLTAQVYQTMADKPTQDQAAMQQAAIQSVMANLQPEDYPALMAFGASPASKKMQEVNPQIAAASQAWAAKLVADNEATMKLLATKAAAEYLAQKK